MKLLCDGFSETGLKRTINQDSIGMFPGEGEGLFLVSDGMGGHSEGERASQAIGEACRQWWEARQEREIRPGFQETMGQLKELLGQASRKIREDTKEGEICGATVVLLWIQEGSYGLIWSGDSRCYLADQRFLGTRIRQLTIDDVWENQPELSQQFSKDEILSHPNRGRLVRAAGVKKEFTCTAQTGILERKMLFALCSDGVYKCMEPEALKEALKLAIKGDGLARPLADMENAVYENQAPDNLSCVLVKVTE